MSIRRLRVLFPSMVCTLQENGPCGYYTAELSLLFEQPTARAGSERCAVLLYFLIIIIQYSFFFNQMRTGTFIWFVDFFNQTRTGTFVWFVDQSHPARWARGRLPPSIIGQRWANILVRMWIGRITVFLPHNLTRDMRIVQSNENTLPDAAKSLKPIMVSFDLIAGNHFVFVEEISPKTQTSWAG